MEFTITRLTLQSIVLYSSIKKILQNMPLLCIQRLWPLQAIYLYNCYVNIKSQYIHNILYTYNMYIRWKIPPYMYKYIMHKITYAYFQCRYNIIFIVFCPYIICVVTSNYTKYRGNFLWFNSYTKPSTS